LKKTDNSGSKIFLKKFLSLKLKNEEKLNIKEVKCIYVLELEWKQGKMRPVDQKTYRSKFDEQ